MSPARFEAKVNSKTIQHAPLLHLKKDFMKTNAVFTKSFEMTKKAKKVDSTSSIEQHWLIKPLMPGGNRRSYVLRPAAFSCRFVQYV